MSAKTLEAALARIGVDVSVDEAGKIAVLTSSHIPERFALDAPRRREIVALGRAHGFANVCVEIADTDAPVPRP